MHSASGPQDLAGRAFVLILPFVKNEIAAREGAIIASALLPYLDVRGDADTETAVSLSVSQAHSYRPLCHRIVLVMRKRRYVLRYPLIQEFLCTFGHVASLTIETRMQAW
jgi:hypothetical protein